MGYFDDTSHQRMVTGDMESNLAQSGQHDNWVLRRAAGGGSFKFSNLDRIHQLSRPAQVDR